MILPKTKNIILDNIVELKATLEELELAIENERLTDAVCNLVVLIRVAAQTVKFVHDKKIEKMITKN